MKKKAILLHSFAEDHRQYDRVREYLDEKIEIIALDSPGVNKTKPLHDDTLECYEHWLELQIDRNYSEGDEIYLVAFDSATVLVSHYLEDRHDGRFAGVFFISPILRVGAKQRRAAMIPSIATTISKILPTKLTFKLCRRLGWNKIKYIQSGLLDLKLSCMTTLPIQKTRSFVVIGLYDQITDSDIGLQAYASANSYPHLFIEADHFSIIKTHGYSLAMLINNFICPR